MPERLHYFDNLRAFLMLLGIVFHASLAYSPFLHDVWMSADVQQAQWVDVFMHLTHVFRMPLFFLVSGYFAALMVERKGLPGFLENRFLRVGLPFIIFWPAVSAAVWFPLSWALGNIDNLSPLLRVIADTQAEPEASKPPASTLHLWFLYYLLFFYGVTWLFCKRIPLGLKVWLLSLSPWVLLLVFPLCLLPALWSIVLPFPAADSFFPECWALAFFGLFYGFGYLLFSSMHQIDFFTNKIALLFVGVGALSWIYIGFLPDKSMPEFSSAMNFNRSVLVLVFAYCAVWSSLLVLLLARKWLDSRNRLLRYIADASYWMYIVHFPLVLMIQYCLLDRPWSLMLEFGLSTGLTLLLSFLSYVLLVRHTPLGSLLNGRRVPLAQGT